MSVQLDYAKISVTLLRVTNGASETPTNMGTLTNKLYPQFLWMSAA